MLRWSPLAGALACALLVPSNIPARAGPAIEGGPVRMVIRDTVPQRIVSLVPVATEILFRLGEGARLVGRSRYDDYPPEALLIPDVGDAIRPSIETVLLKDPDLVILIGGSDNADAVREMERLGIPHMVVLFNTLDELRDNIIRIGRVVERQGRATELWERIDAELTAVRAAVEGRPRPTVYYDVGYPPAFTIGAGSYLDTLVSVAGGRNVFGGIAAPSPRVSLEAIIARDPDVIVYPVGGTGPVHAAGPGERPGWENLRAVREGAVVQVPAQLMHRLGPRVGEAAMSLAAALHPESREALGAR